jgi:hypothetical protein
MIMNLLEELGLWLLSRRRNNLVAKIRHELDGCVSRTDESQPTIRKGATFMGHISAPIHDFTTIEDASDKSFPV